MSSQALDIGLFGGYSEHVLDESARPMSDPTTEYTIDELAAQARIPSRTVRFYQARGVLMAPEIRGRVAYYGLAHLERLKLIAQLQDRGLRIDAIRNVLQSIDRGELDLAEWLGLERQLEAPWVSDQPRTVSEAELYELAGSDRPGLLSDLARAGLIERRGEVYLLESPSLLNIALKLDSVGVDLDTAVEASTLMRKHMAHMVRDLVELFLRRTRDGSLDVKEPAGFFAALRPSAIEAVRVLFAREMERELRAALSSGKLANLQSARRRSKKRR